MRATEQARGPTPIPVVLRQLAERTPTPPVLPAEVLALQEEKVLGERRMRAAVLTVRVA